MKKVITVILALILTLTSTFSVVSAESLLMANETELVVDVVTGYDEIKIVFDKNIESLTEEKYFNT